jgi:hypothetical protein
MANPITDTVVSTFDADEWLETRDLCARPATSPKGDPPLGSHVNPDALTSVDGRYLADGGSEGERDRFERLRVRSWEPGR